MSKTKKTDVPTQTQIHKAVPGFVKETLGQAQKRLTLIEGQARELFTTTWTRVREVKSLKVVEQAISDWRQRYNQNLDVNRFRKVAEEFGSENIHRALHTVGIATQDDLKLVERKIERLRSDLRKMNRSHRPRRNNKSAKKADRK